MVIYWLHIEPINNQKITEYDYKIREKHEKYNRIQHKMCCQILA